MKDFGFKDQICRASISISNNIAEGFDRSSDADFSRFLYIAIASCSEVKSMLHLAEKLKYIDNEKKNNLLERGNEISKIIRGLIKSLNKDKVKVVRGKLLNIFLPLFTMLITYAF